MKFFLPAALLVCAFSAYSADFTTGQAARGVIGQLEFTQHNYIASNQIVAGVGGVAYDPVHGTLWVTEGNLIGATPYNNRVLGFQTNQIQSPTADMLTAAAPPSGFCFLCGYTASTVLGQVDFISVNPGTAQTAASSTAGSMNSPTAVATDGTHFAVADTANGRVLLWNSYPGTNQPADIVLGQTNFTTSAVATAIGASTLRAPQGVWIQNGKVFVADTGNNRVLIWNSWPTSNGQAADLVLGQPDFVTNNAPQVSSTGVPNSPAAANQLWNPVSVTSDGTRLYVADFGFNRVLIWNSIPTGNAQTADVEVGQVDMSGDTSNNSSQLCASNGTDSSGNATYPDRCEKTLSHPRYALSDGTRLFIADTGNDRVLIYNSIPSSNQAAANTVLGQIDFTSNAIASNTSTITSFVTNVGSTDTTPSPLSLAYDGANLYVSDPTDFRVLFFTPGDIPITGRQVLNNASKIVRQEGLILLAGKAVSGDTITVTISGTNYTYTVTSSDTLDTITANTIKAINANSGDPNVTALASSASDTILLLAKSASADLNSIAYSATTSNSTDITATTAGAYLAGGFSGTLAPGTLFEIDNQDTAATATSSDALADFTQTANTAQNLPTAMTNGSGSQVEVVLDGFAVPILSVSPTQVVAQVPFSYITTSATADRTSLSVYVRSTRSNGQIVTTTAGGAAFTDANPGLFAVYPATEPRPALNAMHQAGNPSSTVTITGTVTAGDVVAISVAGTSYSYTATSSDSLNTIASSIASLINAGNNSSATAAAGAAGTVTITARSSGAAGTGIAISATVTAAKSGGTATETATVSNATTCCSTSGSGLVTVFNPAQPNEVITFLGTGLGIVQDSSGTVQEPPPGTPYTGAQPNSVLNLANAEVNGASATVINAGLPNGSEGVYQVQIQMPGTLPASGVTSVYIAQGAFIGNTVTIPVGSAQGHTLEVDIDAPSSAQTVVPGTLQAFGWAGDPNSTVTSISLSLDGQALPAPTRGARPDVCQAFPAFQDCVNGAPVGWSLPIDTTQLSRSSHVLSVTVTSSDGDLQTSQVTFSVEQSVRLNIDGPAQAATVSGTAQVWGWAASLAAAVAPNSVTYSVDGGAPQGTTSFARPDVCSAIPALFDCEHGNQNVGYTAILDTTQLTNGSHTLIVQVTDGNGVHRTASQLFTVNNSQSGVQVDIDSPGNGETLTGAASLFGWAGGSSLVSRVAIWIDGAFMSNASMGMRPDVCAAHPSFAGCPSSAPLGWAYALDTATLANGTHQLQVVAYAAGQTFSQTASFTVSNWAGASPTQASIDSPAAGSVQSGSAGFFGWAISSEGSIVGIRAMVDGVVVPATYGAARPDVCNAYPGRAGCPNVGWAAQVDTTALADGQHVFTLSATASNGQVYTLANNFTVDNSGNGLSVFIDSDLSAALTGPTNIFGWAGSAAGAVTQVSFAIDGQALGSTTETVHRPDVCAIYSNYVGCPNGNLGWGFSFDPTVYGPGTHTFSATATTGSVTRTVSKTVTVGSASGIAISIDNPSSSTTLVGTVSLWGWASDASGNLGSVALAIDGVPLSGTVTYGSRPDVCSARHYSGTCSHVGWSLLVDTTLFSDGVHTLSVTAVSAGQRAISTQPITIANWTNASPIQIYVDNPSAGVNYTNELQLRGWAISSLGGVTGVTISIDNLIVNQPATYGYSRPDVCAVYSGSNCPNVGWYYDLDTTLLPDGTHTLVITAQLAQTGPFGVPETVSTSTTFTIANYSQL